MRARQKPCFTTVGTCPADVPGDSERESAPSGTQADFWRSVQDTGVARVTSNRAQRAGPRCARCASSRSCAASATGFSPRRAARSTSANRSAARARSSRSSGGVRHEAAVRRQHGLGEVRVAVEAEQVAEVGAGRAGVGELPVHDAGDVEGVGVDQQVLGVQVAVHQAVPAVRRRGGPGRRSATAARPSAVSGDHARRSSWALTQAGRSAAPRGADRSSATGR